MLAMTLCVTAQGFAQVQFNGGATIDFTGFAGGGFAPSPSAGQLDSDDWAVTGLSDGPGAFGGTFTTGDFARGSSSGGVSTGGVYAFDINGNVAMGVQPAGSDFTPGTFTLQVQNATGATLTTMDVAYVAYYLNDQTRGNNFNFSWSTDGANFTGVPALDLVSPDAPSGSWMSFPMSTTISGFSVADGGLLYLRWSGDDVSGGGSRDEFALDDIVLGAGGDPMGACTLIDSCVITTQDDCQNNLGGFYEGDGTTCPAPTGACCEGGVCSAVVPEADCLSVGGTYKGDGTDCFTPNICDPGAGACCVTGVCQVAANPTDCCTLGGVYLGEGATCDAGACDQVGTIDDTKSLTDGAPITVADVVIVSTDDLISSSASKSITVQDMSGPAGAARGITVFGPNADIDAILGVAGPGSILSISGELDVYNGLNELSFITGYHVCGNVTSVPAPIAITTTDMQDGSATAEGLESVRVTLSCVEFDLAGNTFAGGTNYTVTEQGGGLTAVVRVPTSALPIVGQTIPAGGVSITGILAQFDASDPRDGGYQLLVSSLGDITTCGTAVGACFINGGADCVVTTLADCNSQSGAYQGDGTSCPLPTGACCEGNGTICSDAVTQVDCEAVGGSYRGDNSLCSTPGVCDIGAGACCLPGDTCQDVANPDACCALGGVYAGEGTTCATPGVCDVFLTIAEARAVTPGDPIIISNAIVVETTDLVNSGASKSITIQDMSGPAGADRGITVFAPNATIDEILVAAVPGSLITISGQFSPFNGLDEISFIDSFSVCGSTTVPAPIAITTADMQDGSATAEGLESLRVTLSCVTFNDAGGVFAAGTNYTVTDVLNSNTATVRVQTGDLDLVGQTIPSGQVSVTGILTQYDGGTGTPIGYQLLPVTIADIGVCSDPVGACILLDTSCIITTATDCTGQGGAYQGDGATCPDPTGACCVGASCTDAQTQDDCENTLGGVWQGAGSICGVNTCVVGEGACCLGNDTCQTATDATECCGLGGVFLGEGTTCTAGACDSVLSIAEARTMANGTEVTLANVVVVETIDTVSSGSVKSFTVQDMSGTGGDDRGITVFGSNADIDAILAQAPAGSVMSITGTLSTFNGLLELVSPFTVNQVCGSTALPAPVELTTTDLQDGAAAAEDYESVRVTLSCVTFDDAGGLFTGGANFPVTDPNTSLSAIVRVGTADLDLVGQTIPSGLVSVTGFVSQFDSSDPRDGGYQLQLVRFADITACNQMDGACCVTPSFGSCPTCPGDMNGDNVIDLADVADFANALLGKPLSNMGAESCANTDLDMNGDVNGLDTQSFIDLLTSGATCGNSCSVVTATECANLGGVFQGAGTTCDGDPCNP